MKNTVGCFLLKENSSEFSNIIISNANVRKRYLVKCAQLVVTLILRMLFLVCPSIETSSEYIGVIHKRRKYYEYFFCRKSFFCYS